MNVNPLILIILMLVLLVPACTKPPVMIEKVSVLNATDGIVTEVTVLHEPTKKYGAVNAVLPGKALEIGLASGGQPLIAKQALIHWRDAGGHVWSVTLDLSYDHAIVRTGQSVGLLYEIHPSGQAIVKFKE